MKRIVWISCVVFFLSGCGREEVREGSSEATELQIRGATAQLGLVNTLAGLAQKLIIKERPEVSGLALGNALPNTTASMQLKNCKTKSVSFNKTVKSLLGTKLIKLEYEIGYEYGCDFQKKGNYLLNVRFLPRRISIDPLWNIQVSGLSNAPINSGTQASPIAELGFALTFQASGIGTKVTTDSFVLNAKTGDLKAELRDFP